MLGHIQLNIVLACITGTWDHGKRIFRSDGCAFRRIRWPVRLRSCAFGTWTARQRFPEWLGQLTRIPQVLLSENESSFIYL